MGKKTETVLMRCSSYCTCDHTYDLNEFCCHCVLIEIVGACKAGERVPGLASGDLSI